MCGTEPKRPLELEYARKRRARVPRAFRLPFLLALGGLLLWLAVRYGPGREPGLWVPTLAERFEGRTQVARARERATECMRYQAPLDYVAYEEGPPHATNWVSTGSGFSEKLDGARLVRCRMPDCVTALFPAPQFGNGRSALLVHEMPMPSGEPRLVLVYHLPMHQKHAPEPPEWIVDGYDQAGTNAAFTYRQFEGPLVPKVEPGQRLKLYAGQIDPSDPSHITISYHLDEQRGTIDVWLKDDRKLHFVFRDGPWARSTGMQNGPAQGSDGGDARGARNRDGS